MIKEIKRIKVITFVRILMLISIWVSFGNDVTGQITYPHNFTYNGNPLERNHGASDPSVHVWDGTVWMFCSQDHKSYTSNSYAAMDGYHAYSSTDMVNWTDYGDVFNSSMLNANSWGNTQKGWMWAPSASRKKDATGVWTYYLYYPHNKAAIGAGEEWVTGVATAPNPWGPFTDQGILGGWPNIKAAMDPMVFIDDDGQAYIYANSAKVSKLNPDMISLAEAPKNIVYGSSEVSNDPAIRFGEGSYMHKKDGIYYFSFSNSNSEKHSAYYAMGKNPYGPFEWKGPLAPKHAGAQDHHSIIEFKGQWYYFYHIAPPNIPAVKDGQSRIACYDRLFYNPDGTIKLMKDTQGPTFILSTGQTTNGYVKTDTPGPVYEAGTTVTVTGVGDLGYAFSAWSGDIFGTTNPVKIVMNSDKNISASFTPVPIHSLSINATNGTITLDPPGGVYSKGVEVTLTVNNNLGYAFSNWGGDLTGTMNPATIIIDRDKSVTANFTAAITHKIITQAENGSITLNPAGGTYNKNTIVEVRAKANAGYIFSYWSGDPLNVEFYINPNFITMDSDKNITANFVAQIGVPTVSFVKPLDGEKFSDPANLSIQVEAKDSDGTISNVKLYLNDVLIRQENTAPYEWANDLALQNLPKGIFVLRAEATDNTNKTGSKSITITVGNTTEVNEEVKIIPTETVLNQNYPNPFNPETTISFQLSKPSHARITIRNILGEKVSTLVEGDKHAGHYSTVWNGRDNSGNKVASGIYFYMLEANNFLFVKKLILLE